MEGRPDTKYEGESARDDELSWDLSSQTPNGIGENTVRR